MEETHEEKSKDIREAVVKASSIRFTREDVGKDKVIEKDPFSYTAQDDIVAPVEDPIALAAFPNISSNLPPCIDAMAVNVGGMGFTLEQTISSEHPDYGKYEKEIAEERDRLNSWFEWLDIMTPDSWNSLCRNTRRDEETIGTAFWQAVPNSAQAIKDGESPILEITKLPAKYVRFTKKDKVEIEVTVRVLHNFEYKEVKIGRRFRKIVEHVAGKKVFFKEYLDPRVIDPNTGEEKELPISKQANRVIVFKIYNSESDPYGLPRWYGNTVAIGYAREAENVIYLYFRDNAIPPLVVLVSGGKLAEGAIDQIKEHMRAHKGRSAQFSTLILEAEPSSVGEGSRNVRVDLRPLAGAQFDVNKFRDIDKDVWDKTLGMFKLPPIVVGKSTDYNRATAETALMMAEQQVFGPERDEFDHIINTTIMNTFNARFHRYASKKPELSEPADLNDLLDVLTNVLAITPKEARSIAGRYLRIDLPPYEESSLEGTGGKVPAPILLERLKESADARATEEDKTITKAITNGNVAEQFVDLLIKVRHNLEQRAEEGENLAEKFEEETADVQ
jgi:PBSX family phage portal protein